MITELVTIIKRLRELANGIEVDKDPVFYNYKNNLLAVSLNKDKVELNDSLIKEIKDNIYTIRDKKEKILFNINDFLSYKLNKQSLDDQLEENDPDIEVEVINVTDEVRNNWYEQIKMEVDDYDKLFFSINNFNKQSITKPKSKNDIPTSLGVENLSDELLKMIYNFKIIKNKKTVKFIDHSKTSFEDFCLIIKSDDLSKEAARKNYIQLACPTNVAIQILTALSSKLFKNSRIWDVIGKFQIIRTKPSPKKSSTVLGPSNASSTGTHNTAKPNKYSLEVHEELESILK